MWAVFYRADPMVMGFPPETTGDWHKANLIYECLKHLHEFLIHFITTTTTSTGHLKTTEIQGDHVSRDSPCDNEECTPGNYKPTALQFPVRFQLGADFGDYLIVEGCGGFRRRPFSQHQQNPQHHPLRERRDNYCLRSSGEQWYNHFLSTLAVS